MFLDRPVNLMDTAVYWTEYVIRYKGAPQLRSAAVDLPWYQEALLDVFGFLLIVTMVAAYIIKRIFCALLCCRSQENEKLKRL